ncbi:peroxidase 66-like [Vigna angularis]|uniref:peroxidase 66-like n=1 Tax=Phaseolus angularis TaxID=3914 RepID=UPI0022B4CB74|nr:peroxidase 66-like [Vigna angularis]
MMKINVIWPLFYIIVPLAFGELKVGFYDSSCPKAESIVNKLVQNRFDRDKTITAALLRLHFHDCAVRIVTRELHDGSERHVIMNERQVERDQGHVELDQQEVESRRSTRIRKENSLLKGFARRPSVHAADNIFGILFRYISLTESINFFLYCC